MSFKIRQVGSPIEKQKKKKRERNLGGYGRRNKMVERKIVGLISSLHNRPIGQQTERQ